MKRPQLFLVAIVCAAALAACKKADPAPDAAATAPTAAAPADKATPAAPVTLKAGASVDVAATVPQCSDGTNGGGKFAPVTLPDNLGFGWSPVTKPTAATQYAAELTKTTKAGGTPQVMQRKVLKADDKLEVLAGERAADTGYHVKVVAWDDKAPICVVDGINGLSPLGK